MSETRFVGAWTFQSSVIPVWQAAYIWPAIRLLRLVRIRQRNVPTGKPSLGSLPAEIWDLIETQIIDTEWEVSQYQRPSQDCGCDEYLYEEFSADKKVQMAIEASRGYEDYQAGYMDWVEMVDDFVNTNIGNRLWRSFCKQHSKSCQSHKANNAEWRSLYAFLRPDSKSVGPDESDELEYLRTFLGDHHLTSFPTSAGVPSSLDAENDIKIGDTVTLAFEPTLTTLSSETWENSSPFPYNISKAIARLQHLIVISEDTDRLAGVQTFFRWSSAPGQLASQSSANPGSANTPGGDAEGPISSKNEDEA